MSGTNKVVVGKILGTGSAFDVKGVGFRPRVVRLFNELGLELSWQSSMPDASGQKRIANGTGSYITSNGITPLADGFTIGTDAVNLAVMIHWMAID